MEKYDKCDPCRLEEIVTGDECWIYHFQLDSKAKNKVWVSSEGVAKHQIACCMRYSLIRKVQSFKFQSRKVVLSLESFTEKVFLLNLLISIRNAYRAPVSAASNYSMITHRPINPLRYNDNAPAHKSTTVQEYQKESGLDVLDHPPYSPDLSPCDFWLFPRLKEMLARHRFESRCGIGSAVYQCLQHIPKEDYRAAFRKWADRCKMCVEADGAYFEGLSSDISSGFKKTTLLFQLKKCPSYTCKILKLYHLPFKSYGQC